MALLQSVLVGGLIAVLFIVLNSLLLWLVSNKILKYRTREFGVGLKVAAIAGIISYALGLVSMLFSGTTLTLFSIVALIVNTIIVIWLIRKFYDVEIKEAVFAWAILFVADILLGILVGLILGFFFPMKI